MSDRREFLTHLAGAAVAVAAPSEAFRAASRFIGQGRSVVQTVTGPIDASKLGFTLTHEHVLAADLTWRAAFVAGLLTRFRDGAR